jgi:hypothetical protein
LRAIGAILSIILFFVPLKITVKKRTTRGF